MRTLSPVILVISLVLSVGSAPARAGEAPTEYEVKAAFLYNFTSFVEWPAAASPSSADPLVIGVLGQDPFGPLLDNLVQGKQSNGRSIVVRRIPRGGPIADCHLLYISSSERNRTDSVVSQLSGLPILTVTDLDPRECVGLMLFMAVGENGRIRLLINAAAAEQTGLKVSSRLLRLAEIIGDK